MLWRQVDIELAPKARGCHLVTREVEAKLPMLRDFKFGIAHLFLLHTSAGLAISENASPDVLTDMAADFDRLVPERGRDYAHTVEGPDDMPAHTKAVMSGCSLSLPIRDGGFYFGTWQGIYLLEFRNRAGSRRIAATLHGQ